MYSVLSCFWAVLSVSCKVERASLSVGLPVKKFGEEGLGVGLGSSMSCRLSRGE